MYDREWSLPSKVTTIGLLLELKVLKTRTAFLGVGFVELILVAISVIVVAGAVVVGTSGIVVVSEQLNVSHGHPPGQFF